MFTPNKESGWSKMMEPAREVRSGISLHITNTFTHVLTYQRRFYIESDYFHLATVSLGLANILSYSQSN